MLRNPLIGNNQIMVSLVLKILFHLGSYVDKNRFQNRNEIFYPYVR